MNPLQPTRRGRTAPRRSGAALLLALFVTAACSLLVVMILDAETSQLAAHRHTLEYERALYLAGAGIHHALAELEADANWRGTVGEGAFPADGSYEATASDVGPNVVVVGTGVAGEIQRRIQVTLK